MKSIQPMHENVSLYTKTQSEVVGLLSTDPPAAIPDHLLYQLAAEWVGMDEAATRWMMVRMRDEALVAFADEIDRLSRSAAIQAGEFRDFLDRERHSLTYVYVPPEVRADPRWNPDLADDEIPF